MKANKVAAALAVVGAGVQAQSSQPVSYTTVTYDTCPTSVVESLITVTNGVTVTYCPLCDQGGAQPTGPPGSGSPPPPPSGGETTHTTVYTTVYESLCPTGVTQQTYTITESCTGPTPSWNTDSNHIPPDFTVTVETCHVCEATPVPKTITKPCGCKASEGVTMPPNQPNAAPTPPPGGSPPPPPGGNGAPPPPPGGNGGSGAQCPGPQCKGDSNNNGGSGSGNNNGGSGSQCPGPQCNGGSGSGNNNGGSGSGSPMGGNNGTAPGCPGPQCQSGMPSGPGCPGPQCQNGMSTAPAAPGSASGPSGSTPTSGPNACPGPQCKTSPSPQPYTGSASNFGAAGIVSTLFVAAVAALAFGL